MKKNIIAIAAIAAAFTMASCNKELVNPNENPTVGKSVITATIENDATKTALTPDEEGYKVVWTAGDQLFVGDDQGTDWCAQYTLDNESVDSSNGVFSWQEGDFFYTEQKEKYTEPRFEVDNTYIAMYPFDLYELDDEGAPAYGITWKTEQTYNSTDRYIPMYGVAECTNEGVVGFKFNNLGGILRLTVKGSTSIESIRIEANEILSGPIARIDCEGVEGNEFIACLEAVSENNKKYIDLNCGDGVQLSSDGTDFYISMPCKFSYDEKDNIVFDGYSDVIITLTDTEGRTCVKKLNNKNLVIERSKITAATFTASEFKDNILPGEFSVSDTKKVRFSKGNLRYTIASGKWSFFDEQYQCGPESYSGGHYAVISLFTWGYDNWSIVPDGEDFNTKQEEEGDLTQAEDWGSQIGDGSTWRTLTAAEWQYLFSYDDYSNDIRKNKYTQGVTVCDRTNCVIIAPDDWNINENPLMSEYTPSEWATAEAAGLVCLAPVGYREGDFVDDVGGYSYYWSSTPASYSNSTYAYCVNFSDWYFNAGYTSGRDGGFAVRLVIDVTE